MAPTQADVESTTKLATDDTSARGLARVGMGLADWSQRWFPDAFIFGLIALFLTFIGALAVGTAPRDVVKYFGDGFWSIIPFTMQMAIVIIG